MNGYTLPDLLATPQSATSAAGVAPIGYHWATSQDCGRKDGEGPMASAELQKSRRLATKLAGVISEHFADSRIAELRRLLDEHALPPPAGTAVMPVDAGGVRAEWLLAPGSHPANRLLYFHGGGYVLGSLDSHRSLAARIGEAAESAVLAVDYRLAPEHPFPAAVEDGLAALRWMRVNGPQRPAPANNWFVGGDSAGGGLALAVLLAARDTNESLPDAAIMVCAWTDLAGTGDSLVSRREVDPMADQQRLDFEAALYLNGADPRTPSASPLYADLHGLPPLLMQVGDAEMLLDDTTRLAEKARVAGVEVVLEVWPEMPHVWHSYAGFLPEGQQAIERIGQFIRAHAHAQAR